ncbi:hypothetical protein TNCV_3749751 [Trichonephila clavipes]|nr:hypothetical protein TNCV_3749751 [Trichonephila clavipes]
MVVSRSWQQCITEGIVYGRGGSGCLKNTNAGDDSAIKRVATSLSIASIESVGHHLPPFRHPVVSFISKTKFVHILCDFPNNAFKDMTYSCRLPDHQTSR